MTTYKTGNPIGSTDARDRLDNTENMDILENSVTLNEHPDRLGVLRKTRKGMELEHHNQMAAHEAEHDNQMTAHEAEHDNQIQSFENDFDSRLAGMAFTRVGTFTAGATLTDMRQTMLWERSHGGDGHEYGWSGAFPKVVSAGSTPATSGSIGAGAWVDRTDDTLRSELAATNGASLVGYSFNGTAYSVRNVLNKLRDAAVSLEDFGAVGDGVTDDTPALQAAHDLLGYGSYIALSPGKTYVITGFTFTKIIALGCPYGRAAIKTTLGLRWDISSGILDIVIENIDVYSTTTPSISNKVTALSFESAVKNYGVGGYTVVNNVIIKKDGALAFYNGISFKNTPVIVDGCTIKLKESHTKPLAKDGSLEQWEANSGVGISIDSCTYASIGNCRVYYAMDGYLVKGQAEDVHIHSCFALLNRRCYVFESLVTPSNEQRINNCHGATYFCGIEMGDSSGRNVLCSIESSSILAARDATAAQIIYAMLFLDGANINNFQAYNDGTRGSNDIGIYLRSFGGVGARRVMVSGLHCRGVGTGVYLDTNERNYISNVSMIQLNMVGSGPKAYAYGPNNTLAPVSTAYGIREQENVFPTRMTAPMIMATDSIGLKAENTVSGLGADQFKIRNVSGNYWIESANESGELQHNASIDQGGSLRTKNINPLLNETYYLGSPPLRWNTVFATTGTINTSDAREKTAPLPIDDAVLDAWGDVQLITFQWLDAIRSKGEDVARWHFGVIAQQVRDTFIAHHLDGCDYGLLCYDEWLDEFEPIIDVRKNPETDELEKYETGELRQTQVAGNRWGIRADQCLFLEAAYQRRNYQQLLMRVEALESKE